MQTDRHRERQRVRPIEARSAGAEDRKKHGEKDIDRHIRQRKTKGRKRGGW